MNMRPDLVMGRTEWGLLIMLTMIWSSSYLFAQLAMDDVPVILIVFSRVSLAAVGLWMVILAMGIRLPREPHMAWRLCVLGLFNNVLPFTLVFTAQKTMPTGVVAVMIAATPLIGILLAQWMTTDERLTAARMIGALLGLGGVAVMIGPEALAGLGGGTVAELLVILAAICFAFSPLYARRLYGIEPMIVAAGQLTAASLILLPVAAVMAPPWTLAVPNWGSVASLAVLALVCTGLAYVIYFRIIAKAGATNTILVTILSPPGAMFLGATILGETLSVGQLAGFVLVVTGIAVTDGRPLAWLRRRGRARTGRFPG